MIVFLLGVLTGVAIGFVLGGVWMVVMERRLQAKLRAWGVQRELRRLQGDDDE